MTDVSDIIESQFFMTLQPNFTHLSLKLLLELGYKHYGALS